VEIGTRLGLIYSQNMASTTSEVADRLATIYKRYPGEFHAIHVMSFVQELQQRIVRASKPATSSPRCQSHTMGQGYINCRYFGVCCLKLLRGDSTPCGEHPLRSRPFRCTSFPSPWIDHQLIEPPDMQLWANIYTMEITSDECLTEVRSLLNCRSNVNVVRSLRGNDAQTFIDFLDKVSRSCTPYLKN